MEPNTTNNIIMWIRKKNRLPPSDYVYVESPTGKRRLRVRVEIFDFAWRLCWIIHKKKKLNSFLKKKKHSFFYTKRLFFSPLSSLSLSLTRSLFFLSLSCSLLMISCSFEQHFLLTTRRAYYPIIFICMMDCIPASFWARYASWPSSQWDVFHSHSSGTVSPMLGVASDPRDLNHRWTVHR